MEKYKIRTDLSKVVNDVTLYRIEALADFKHAKKGELGGYVQNEKNLSQFGDAWVCGDAKVSGDASVFGDAWVCGNAKVSGNADYFVSKNIWSSGRSFTYTRSNRKWRVGCFYGTSEELIKKANKDSEVSGREYKRIVEYVEAMYAALENDKK